MKPKLNQLTKIVECQENIFPDIPDIFVGNINPEKIVFDATAYCEAVDAELPPYSAFYTQCYRYIDAICKNTEKKSSELFYVNTDKHLLIDVSLALIFIQYVNPETCFYFNNMVITCLTNGIAFSEGFVMQMASLQLPDEALQEIIKSRHEQKEE